jgi:hypothetical protein
MTGVMRIRAVASRFGRDVNEFLGIEREDDTGSSRQSSAVSYSQKTERAAVGRPTEN